MEGYRFDTWTKALLAVGTRRTALRLVTGGATGLFGLSRAEDAVACRLPGKKCKKAKQCCSAKCKGKKGKKKCRCTPLQAPCDHADEGCCPVSGAGIGCLGQGKPQCGSSTFRCLLRTDDPCTDDCDCASGLTCGSGGTPDPRCCLAAGVDCGPNEFDYLCCSLHCGCAAPASCTCRNVGCQGLGGGCSQTLQCCGGVCSSGKCCLPLGIACTNTQQCCGVLFCNAGFCDTL